MWGTPTASVDWCEDNYTVSYYVAEFFNTLSSVPIALLGLQALWSAWACADAHASRRRRMVAAFTVFVVGVGSVAFHGTLLRWGQVLDEVPMVRAGLPGGYLLSLTRPPLLLGVARLQLWSSTSFVFLAVSLQWPPGDRRVLPLGIALAVYASGATALYFVYGFEYFLVTYVATVAVVIFATARQARLLGAPKQGSPPRMAAAIVRYAAAAAGLYAGGFLVLWIPEQILCGNRLETSHDTVFSRVSLHAFFHITSALGPYAWLCFAALGRAKVLGKRAVVAWRPSVLLCGAPTPFVDVEAAA